MSTTTKPNLYSAAVVARRISKILRQYGFEKADLWREGYFVRRIGHSRSVAVDYHIPNYQPERHKNLRESKVAQMRETLFELGYKFSHPDSIYIECERS